MKALQYAQIGEPVDVVAPAELPTPSPGAGDLRIRMSRSPIHNHDLATIRGVYGVRPALPAIGGSEFAGEVDAAGDRATNIATGTRVACAGHATWAEYVIVPAARVVPIPSAITDEVACQLLAMPLSALVLLDELHVNAGDWILQNAAAGAVGTIVMREAQKRGINVINLVRSEESARRLEAAGAKHVVITKDSGWWSEVREIAGDKPIVRAIDSVGGLQTLQLERLLAKHGELIIFGALEREALKLDPGLMISNELVVRGFWMNAWMRRANPADVAAASQRVFALAMSGELPLPVDHVYPFDQCRDAFVAAETAGRKGKVLFTP